MYSNPKLPAYAKPLAELLRFGNLPFLVVVCIGLDAWPRAKRWQESPNGCWSVVLPAGKNPFCYRWPVSDCSCVIDAGAGPSAQDLADLAGALWLAGAKSVTQVRRDTDPNEVDFYRRLDDARRECT